MFFFINGLQTWAKTKIHEKKVQDLATAIASTERLLDYGNEVSYQRKTTQALNTGAKHINRYVTEMEAPTGQTEVTIDQAGGQIDLLKTTKRGHLEDLTLKGTTRSYLYNAYCVKAPTKCPTVLIGPLSLHSKCPS